MLDLIACKRCQRQLPESAFYCDRNGYRFLVCDDCHSERQRRSAQEILRIRGLARKRPGRLTLGGMSGDERVAYWGNFKRAQGCADCGYAENDKLMHFDHLPEFRKLFDIGAAVRKTGFYTDAEIAAEVEKCEVVCKWCHEKRTSKRALGVRARDLFPIYDESSIR